MRVALLFGLGAGLVCDVRSLPQECAFEPYPEYLVAVCGLCDPGGAHCLYDEEVWEISYRLVSHQIQECDLAYFSAFLLVSHWSVSTSRLDINASRFLPLFEAVDQRCC